MESVVRTIERITGNTGLIVALIIVPLVLATCFEVFSRYVFNAPTVWAYELGYILTGTHFLLGAALALMKGAHVRIDVLYSQFSQRTKAAVDMALYLLLFLPFLILLSNSLLDYALHAWEAGERSGQSAWNPPIWPFRMLLTLGFAMLTLQVVAEVIKCACVLRGRPVTDTQED